MAGSWRWRSRGFTELLRVVYTRPLSAHQKGRMMLITPHFISSLLPAPSLLESKQEHRSAGSVARLRVNVAFQAARAQIV